jgi:hypothetical protein
MEPVINPCPTIRQVAEVLEGTIGRFIELDYERLFPRRVDHECLYSEPEEAFRGFTGEDQGEVFRSAAGNWLFRTRMMTRRNASDGTYCWRSLRIEGILLDTIKVNDGSRGKVRLFPNVPPMFKAGAPADERTEAFIQGADAGTLAQLGEI